MGELQRLPWPALLGALPRERGYVLIGHGSHLVVDPDSEELPALLDEGDEEYDYAASMRRAHRGVGTRISALIRIAATPRSRAWTGEWKAVLPLRLTVDRLTEIGHALGAEAQKIFGPGEYVPVTTPDTDPESSAAYRVTLSASPDGVDADRWALGAFELQRWFVKSLLPHERESLRLVVLPGPE